MVLLFGLLVSKSSAGGAAAKGAAASNAARGAASNAARVTSGATSDTIKLLDKDALTNTARHAIVHTST